MKNSNEEINYNEPDLQLGIVYSTEMFAAVSSEVVPS